MALHHWNSNIHVWKHTQTAAAQGFTQQYGNYLEKLTDIEIHAVLAVLSRTIFFFEVNGTYSVEEDLGTGDYDEEEVGDELAEALCAFDGCTGEEVMDMILAIVEIIRERQRTAQHSLSA
jgi:hypothetical protein